MKFECKKCGKCCRSISRTGLLKEFENENGECIHLTDDNRCDIYDNRPDICNVEKMYELHFHKFMTFEEYMKHNKDMCCFLNSK
ncbi:MAG: YkgJ family cysteine cluster protein [Ruminococcus sp.]|nr:YkgJ family cysteine cluster protein [Ruminococcus sp.]